MFVRFGHVLLIVALLAATGGHWVLLQTVAWTNMLAENLRTESLGVAIAKTFDGEHPCAMCKVIKQARSEKQKQDQQAPDTRLQLEFPLPAGRLVLIAPEFAEVLPIGTGKSSSFLLKPPTPPPRPAAV